LRIKKPGYGFIHFNEDLDEEYFKQLLGEAPEESRHRGRKVVKWVKTRDRQEGLDCFVYASGALHAFCFLAYPQLTMVQIIDDLYSMQRGQALEFLEAENEETYGEIESGLGLASLM
jgi:phage terminase large subunit GpA-like protein